MTYSWLKNGALLQDNGHLSSTQSTNLIVTGVIFADLGDYQFVASNNSGAVTSSITQLVIHCVNGAGSNPLAPYASWDTAATNIQDAIDAAAAGEIVLVTNGIYATGGKVISGDLTNRVVLDKALTVISVNGYTSTIIEGHWDIATNGPAAVRCAWLTNGATLYGFTLRNGATGSGDPYGGGACLSSNALVSNCALTNNSSLYAGGGVAFGTMNNCFLGFNSAIHGGGAYSCHLNNCTVRRNYCFFGSYGGGVESCVSRNCIITDNYSSAYGSPVSGGQVLNFSSFDTFTNCCTSPLPFRGANNISSDPMFLDFDGSGFALSPASPCHGTGNPLFAAGYDLDGEPFLSPPSMGCDEFISTNLTGPLSFQFRYFRTNAIANHSIFFVTQFDGRPSELDWSFGDGPTVTNLGAYTPHTWTNAGTYTVTLTAYNTDNPAGVSSNLVVTIDPFVSPRLQFVGIVSNAFQFSFAAQEYGFYTVQYATNLTPPIAWQNLQMLPPSTTNTMMTIQDQYVTNGMRFYRVMGQ